MWIAVFILIYGKEKPVLITQVLIKIYSRITKYLFNSADEVHFPSFWLKELYEKWNFFSDSKKKVVRNFRINTEDLLKHKKLKKQGEINFLYLGQIEEYKGILFLIETLHKLQALPYRLRVVGQGSQLKRAKEIAKDNPNIVFYGYQAPAQLNNFFSQSDFTIVPSICYENSPNVIYESLQAKIPVIAAKIGGIPELIKHKKNGLLFKAGQANGLLKAVKMSINLSQ